MNDLIDRLNKLNFCGKKVLVDTALLAEAFNALVALNALSTAQRATGADDLARALREVMELENASARARVYAEEWDSAFENAKIALAKYRSLK